jgi:tetratricopeptide (TPR) repeat protein
MSRSQDEQVRRIVELRRAKRFKEALQACDETTREFGVSVELTVERAQVLARLHEYRAAISEMSRVIEMGSARLEHYFDRGRWCMKDGDYEQAVVDFAQVLRPDNSPEAAFFRSITQFYRAYCSLLSGSASDALRDALSCDDEGPVWVGDRLVDRDWLIREARRKTIKIVGSERSPNDAKKDSEPGC